MNYKELLLYALMAIVVVSIVVFVLTKGIIGGSYNVQVKLSQIGQTAVYPYETEYYIINITNTGRTQLNDLLVGFYLDGVAESTNTISLPPGTSVDLLRNYTYPTAGLYSFQAVADPSHILNLENRQTAQSSITVNITQPEIPNVFTSIPNNNIKTVQTFTFANPQGAISAVALATRYNVTLFNRLFGPGEKISTSVFENAYQGTADVYGVYASYENNSTAYTAWIQGTVNPEIVGEVISSYSVPVRQVNVTGGAIEYAPINHTTSICSYYNGGWTKIISYYNDSKSGTCVNISKNTYSPNESVTLTNIVKQNKDVTTDQSLLFFNGSTTLGSALAYSANNLTATNIFENGNFGLFSGSVEKSSTPLNVTAVENSICYGPIFSQNGINVCTYLIPTRTGNYSLPYALLNSTYITSNYKVNIYSLVNNSEIGDVSPNVGNAIKILKINESSVVWTSPFKNSCSFENQSLGCKFNNFTTTNYTANFSIINNFPSTIKINKVNCEIAPGFANVSVNKTLVSNASVDIVQRCNVVAGPLVAAQTSYTLLVNYTYNGTVAYTKGIFNVTNT